MRSMRTSRSCKPGLRTLHRRINSFTPASMDECGAVRCVSSLQAKAAPPRSHTARRRAAAVPPQSAHTLLTSACRLADGSRRDGWPFRIHHGSCCRTPSSSGLPKLPTACGHQSTASSLGISPKRRALRRERVRRSHRCYIQAVSILHAVRPGHGFGRDRYRWRCTPQLVQAARPTARAGARAKIPIHDAIQFVF
jgi:hypothetical protein